MIFSAACRAVRMVEIFQTAQPALTPAVREPGGGFPIAPDARRRGPPRRDPRGGVMLSPKGNLAKWIIPGADLQIYSPEQIAVSPDGKDRLIMFAVGSPSIRQ